MKQLKIINNYSKIEQIKKQKENALIIKIVNNPSEESEVENELTISFKDVNENNNIKIKDNLFSEQHFTKILNFLENKSNISSNIYIYSENNTNRSSAVAILIAKYFGEINLAREILLSSKYFPNKMVLNKSKQIFKNT